MRMRLKIQYGDVEENDPSEQGLKHEDTIMIRKMTRREFAAVAGGAMVSIGLPGTFVTLSAKENREIAGALRPDGRLRIPPGQRAVKTLQDMGGTPGAGNVPSWRLKIYGAVDSPVTLSADRLMALDRVDLTCDVHCVTGWSLLDGRWGGIRLATLMALARVKSNAGFVIFESPEGYTSNIPMAEAKKPNVILADTFQGNPLPPDHGAPFRALVPDLYFWKSTKWVEAIRFSEDDEPGFYETRGYSNTADPWKEQRFDEQAGLGRGRGKVAR